VPLLIMISGSGCIGKSILATQLAERLNLPNIVQTDWIHALLSPWLLPSDPSGVADTRIWRRRFASERRFLDEYRREADAVRHAIEADLTKAQTDGKALIVEGLHLDLGLYDELKPRRAADVPRAHVAPCDAPSAAARHRHVHLC
jgi:2-phosphoglycerate kinase